jgi:hypothetical protein
MCHGRGLFSIVRCAYWAVRCNRWHVSFRLSALVSANKDIEMSAVMGSIRHAFTESASTEVRSELCAALLELFLHLSASAFCRYDDPPNCA